MESGSSPSGEMAMSKRDDGNAADSTPKQVVYDAEMAALAAIREYRQWKLSEAPVGDEVRRQLAEAALSFKEVLHKYRSKGALDPSWEDRNIHWIEEKQNQQVAVKSPTARRNGNAETKRKPAILAVDPEAIVSVIRELEDIADQLGFTAGVTPEPGGSKLPHPNNLNSGPHAEEFEGSHFFRSLYDDIEGSRSGGAIVIVDAEDARTGVGKTAAACAMAEYVAWYFGYELQDRDGVLSGQEYLSLFQQHPNEEQVSVCIWDEAVGAGSGDSRRSMAQENVDLGRAWQIMRDRRVVTFVTLPDWGDLDSRLQKLADYRVWCRRDIGQMQAYEIGTTFQNGELRTRGLGPGDGAEPIAFPDVTEDSDIYQTIKEKKDRVQETDKLDAGELVDDDEDASETEDQKTTLESAAGEVLDRIEEFTGEHPSNGMRYIDADLIDVEFKELSGRDAKKVKKLVEREAGEL